MSVGSEGKWDPMWLRALMVLLSLNPAFTTKHLGCGSQHLFSSPSSFSPWPWHKWAILNEDLPHIRREFPHPISPLSILASSFVFCLFLWFDLVWLFSFFLSPFPIKFLDPFILNFPFGISIFKSLLLSSSAPIPTVKFTCLLHHPSLETKGPLVNKLHSL